MAGRTALAMPPVGLGTLGLSPSLAAQSIHSAIASGYRLIDCAPVYFNEVQVGDGLSREVRSGTVRREDLWITSKLASPFHRREHVEIACRKTLTDLRLDYLDLFLIHWPVAFGYVPIDPTVRGWENEDIDDSDGGKNIDPTVSVGETWEAMEKLVERGLVRNIGVSNFPVALLHDLLCYCNVRPSVNQVELHPYLQQRDLVRYCQGRGVAVQAYSPLGTPGYKGEGEPSVLNDPVLSWMAKEKGCTVAQLCISWALERGCGLNAKASSLDRQRENISALRKPVKLSEEDMRRIAELDRGHRFFRPEDWWGSMHMAVFD